MFLLEWRQFLSAPGLEKKKLADSSRLDVVEIARVPDMLLSLCPSWSGLRTFQHHGTRVKGKPSEGHVFLKFVQLWSQFAASSQTFYI
jgi:hypothetical protein